MEQERPCLDQIGEMSTATRTDAGLGWTSCLMFKKWFVPAISMRPVECEAIAKKGFDTGGRAWLGEYIAAVTGGRAAAGVTFANGVMGVAYLFEPGPGILADLRPDRAPPLYSPTFVMGDMA